MPINKHADLLDRYVSGELGLEELAREIDIHGVILSKLRSGSIVPTTEHIVKIAKYTGRSKVEVARVLEKRVKLKFIALMEAIA